MRNKNEVVMEGSYLRILMMCGLLALLLCGGCWVFAWKHLRRRIDERFDVLSEHLERHAAECPIRKEHLLASCLPADPERKGNGSFHRSFRASYPGFLPTLRERVPGITPAEETLCMLIKMNLSNREIAQQLFLSEGSVKQYINQIYSKLHIEGDTRTKRKALAGLFGQKT